MADGSVILGEIAGSAVTRVASDGGKTVIGSAGGGPNGLARSPDGALYLCNNGRNECAQGGFLSTGPSKDYQCGHIRRINRRDGCCWARIARFTLPKGAIGANMATTIGNPGNVG
jgi:gluconolactonase